ncbi:MAG: peptidoglycan DD-metalloendopeptidase family protein [Herpetosiphonaceae bacterium]|nr:peptidoglycan DD-metalloendopeptidase family protein [Herpetosiphonaceae bacterium]
MLPSPRQSFPYLFLLVSCVVLITVIINSLVRHETKAQTPAYPSPTIRIHRDERPALPPDLPVAQARKATSPSIPSQTPLVTATAVPATPVLAQPAPVPLPQGFGVMRYPTGSAVHGHGLVIIGTTAYSIDAGVLRALPLEGDGRVQTLVPTNNQIDGVATKDWLDLAPTGDGGLWLLDRLGDLARFDPQGGTWRSERHIQDRFHNPEELYVALASFGGRAYILDEAQGQIWRWPATDLAEGYFGGADVWPRIKSGIDLTRAVDVAIDGAVYVLLREEPEPRKQLPARIRKYQGTTLVWEVTAGTTFQRPLRLFADPTAAKLYVIDQDGMRVQVLDEATGSLSRSYTLGVEIRAVAMRNTQLYLLSRDAIYATDWQGVHTAHGGDLDYRAWRPDDPDTWGSVHLASPIPDAFLPDRDALIPGSPRVYRYGVHEGIDFYGIAVGTPIELGTPVHAAAAGTVIRADTAYVELTPDELTSLLQEAEQKRDTPPATEARLRGRQVWIDHGNGLVTRYAHLSGIASRVTVGTVVQTGAVIGYAGNSGTEAGVQHSTADVHLHFEIRLGEQYLGRWLAPLETRRILGQVFGFDSSNVQGK